MTNPTLAAARGMLANAKSHPTGTPGDDQTEHPVDKNRTKSSERREKALEEGLEESFPASDPPAAAQPTPRGPAGDPATKP